jgi:hypothetical protein
MGCARRSPVARSSRCGDEGSSSRSLGRSYGAPIDYTIYDTPWGFREFGVQDPDGHDIAFRSR